MDSSAKMVGDDERCRDDDEDEEVVGRGERSLAKITEIAVPALNREKGSIRK